MTQAALIVFGAFVGALATGGVTAWEGWRQRRERRRVAARLILGDLYLAEAMARMVLKHKRWPDRLDLDSPLETWRESRQAFAGGVQAWEWALVDGVFSNLHRNSLMVRLGEATTQADEEVMADFAKSIPPSQEIVLRHAAPKREQKELVRQLTSRRSHE